MHTSLPPRREDVIEYFKSLRNDIDTNRSRLSPAPPLEGGRESPPNLITMNSPHLHTVGLPHQMPRVPSMELVPSSTNSLLPIPDLHAATTGCIKVPRPPPQRTNVASSATETYLVGAVESPPLSLSSSGRRTRKSEGHMLRQEAILREVTIQNLEAKRDALRSLVHQRRQELDTIRHELDH